MKELCTVHCLELAYLFAENWFYRCESGLEYLHPPRRAVEKTRPALLRHMHVYGTVAMELHDSAWSARWSGGCTLQLAAGGS